MKRKIVILAAVIALFVPEFAFAKFGINIKGGYAGITDNLDKDTGFSQNVQIDPAKARFDFGGEIFYEEKGLLKNKDSVLGFKAGCMFAGAASTDYYDYQDEYVNAYIKAEGMAFPILAYYKYPLFERLQILGGIGVTILKNTWTIEEYDGTFDRFIETEMLAIPQIELGIEFVMSKRLSLLLDANYRFNGKSEVKYALFPNGQHPYIDFSGLLVNMSFKIYLF
jgi:opacity protein-like surface antigen